MSAIWQEGQNSRRNFWILSLNNWDTDCNIHIRLAIKSLNNFTCMKLLLGKPVSTVCSVKSKVLIKKKIIH